MNKAIYLPLSLIFCCILSFVLDNLAVVLLFIPLWFFALFLHVTFDKWIGRVMNYNKETTYSAIFADSSFICLVTCMLGFVLCYANNIPAIVAMSRVSVASFSVFLISLLLSIAAKKIRKADISNSEVRSEDIF